MDQKTKACRRSSWMDLPRQLSNWPPLHPLEGSSGTRRGPCAVPCDEATVGWPWPCHRHVAEGYCKPCPRALHQRGIDIPQTYKLHHADTQDAFHYSAAPGLSCSDHPLRHHSGHCHRCRPTCDMKHVACRLRGHRGCCHPQFVR